jgi:mgtE-like transporter
MLHRDFREILTSELVSITGSLAGGLLLTFATDKIELIPGLLILLPGFLEMRGNISGSMAARLSSGLYVKALRPKFANSRILQGNVAASMVLVVALSFLLGLMAHYVALEFFGVYNPKIVWIAVLAGLLSNFIEVPLTIFMTFQLFRRGDDPNNVMGPYVTTTGDIISIVSLLIALAVI